MPHESHHAGYLLSDDPALLSVTAIHTYLTQTTPTLPVQPSRLGATTGSTGSGLLHPIRAHELEEALAHS